MPMVQVLAILGVIYLVVVVAGWLLVLLVLRKGPAPDGFIGLMWWGTRIYCRIWHRAKYTGLDNLPRSEQDRPGLIVIANHTGAIDPFLIQNRCKFLIHWMMATDTMLPQLEWFWERIGIIPVDRDGKDSGPVRDAIRMVRQGKCVGIFPEGRITMPPEEIRPFFAGVGFIVKKTQAPVMLAWISGTPVTNDMTEGLTTRSYARVEYVGLMEFSQDEDAEEISEKLRLRLAEVSGWPLNDEVLPPGGW